MLDDTTKTQSTDSKSIAESMMDIIHKSLDRHRRWEQKYGEGTFRNKDMYDMIEEELLDSINYLCYEVIKLRELKQKKDNRPESIISNRRLAHSIKYQRNLNSHEILRYQELCKLYKLANWVEPDNNTIFWRGNETLQDIACSGDRYSQAIVWFKDKIKTL